MEPGATICRQAEALIHNSVPQAGRRGFSLPTLNSPVLVRVDENGASELERRGIRITPPYGRDNLIILDNAIGKSNLTVSFGASRESTIIIGVGAPANGSISTRGVACLLVFSGLTDGVGTVKVDVSGDCAVAFFGRDFTSINSHWLLEGDGQRLVVGDDCLISWDVFVRNHDSHDIIDLESDTVRNKPTDFLIGPHVWIGQRGFLRRGVTIGGGAIVGACAVLGNDLPPFSAAAGNPARIVRHNVSWSRHRFGSPVATARELEKVRALVMPLDCSS